MRLVSVFLVIHGFAVAAAADEGKKPSVTRVELIFNEPQPARKAAWPVTTGVPIPRGALQSIDNCLLRDNDGEECLLQARATATWDGPKGSIRWLLIDFIAQPGKKYVLEFGPEVKPKRIASPLRIEQKDRIQVATRAMIADFSMDGAAALQIIRIDRNGDGAIQADEIAASGIGEHYSIDQKGDRASSARDGTERKIVVETNGPVRSCVRVDGFYTGADGKRTAAYRTRYHFFAGLPLIKVVNEYRIIASTRDVRWKDIGFSLNLPIERESWTIAVDASGDAGNQVIAFQPGKETKAVSSFQSVYRHYGNPECRGGVVEVLAKGEKEHRKTERVGEWMQTGDSKIAVTGSLRWLWQQFPAEWEATPERLTLHLSSPRGGELDFGVEGIKRFFGEAGEQYLLDWKGVRDPRTPIERFFYFAGRSALERDEADGLGIRKHHEFYLHFDRAKNVETGQEYGRLAADPPLVLASGKWNCSTDVMGPIVARPNNSPAEKVVDRLFDLGREMQDTFGDYGWWLFGAGPHYSYQWDAKTGKHYADPRRFEFHTYQRDTQHWWNYLRSGERKFLDWALPSENHWVDIAVAHEPTKFFTEYRSGEKMPATLHWPRGDWSIDSTMHYLRHHDTGEAWLRGQAQFWGSYHRTLETTTLAYYLTGDERYNDVLDYWRAYWGDLAGKTSVSKDVQPWHREQAWYKQTGKGAKSVTWAEMIRDYAPFNSGSRHQLTLLFNLATLYEHTWDPKIGRAVREYADAFLDPAHPIGVWRSQDNRGPVHAEAPIMAHFWTPALWRYARATGDPRMPEVFRRYFDACLGADPFREDVGVYSNNHIGYAYAFTKDPRHLRAAASELETLQPFAEPLAKPEDLGTRLYNPYAPIRSFTGVPRLVWALEEAKRTDVKVPPGPITRPQRAPLAFRKLPNEAVELTLWGYDRAVHLLGTDGKRLKDFQIRSKSYASALQPFDRVQPNHEVFMHQLTIDADAAAGWYVVVNPLETAILELRRGKDVCCLATSPVAVHPGVVWHWKVPAAVNDIQILTGQPKDLRLSTSDGKVIDARATTSGYTIGFKREDAGKVIRFENAGTGVVWFCFKEVAPEQSWVAVDATPGELPSHAIHSRAIADDAQVEYPDGRFGGAAAIVPGRNLRLPDHRTVNGVVEKFFDMRQGTLEFFVKRLWDDRLTTPARVSFVTNGLIDAWVPWKLPLNEWAHVALVWRPLKKDPKQIVLHIYVNGLDQANYRSTYWEGYGNRPYSHPTNGKWLENFVSKAAPGIAFHLDELRLSSSPRYVNLDVEFGGQQTVNPVTFQPPTAPFRPDKDTLLLFHFDDDLKSDAGDGKPVEGRWEKTVVKEKK